MESPVTRRIVGRSTSRILATVALFTAIYAVFRYIPTFPMYGLTGTSFRASDFLAPLLGILLGPLLALPCILIGTLINYGVTPPVFLGLDFLPAWSAALVAGLISSGRTKYAIGLFAVILISFLALPLSTFWISVPGGFQVPYAWLHMLAFVALISPLGLNAYKWSKASAGPTLAVGVLITVLSATLAQHLTGGILYELIIFPSFKITTAASAARVWSFLFTVYPLERTVITAITTFFGVSLLRALRSSGMENVLRQVRGPVGPAPSFSENE